MSDFGLFEFFKFDYEVTRAEFDALLPSAFSKIKLAGPLTVEEIKRPDRVGNPVMFLAFGVGERVQPRNGDGAHRVS